jgi:lipopolysaccharide transport system permease protein
MWEYRELIRNLTVAELKNRYQNTALGFLWSVLSPFLYAFVLYFVFRFIFNQEQNFAAYLLVGLMSWRFFLSGTTMSVYSIVGKPSLVTKVYIPRKILVLSCVLTALISSLLEFVVLIPIIFLLAGELHLTLLLFPVIHVIYFWMVYGIGMFLGALYVYLRDMNQIWEVVSNIMFFLSPIIYPMAAITDRTMPFYLLNPITAAIVIYRDLMIYGKMPDLYNLGVLIFFSIGAFLVGSFVFDRLQRRFAEVI